MDRETMDPSQGEKTTMDREILEPSEGERTKDLIPKAKAKVFLENYFSVWAMKEVLGEELAEKKFVESMEQLVKLYREDSWMKFNGENIQGKEAIRAKLTSFKPSRIQVLNIECLPVGGSSAMDFLSDTDFYGRRSAMGFLSDTGFYGRSSAMDFLSDTGFSKPTGFLSGLQGMACGYIWLNGTQDVRFFSQSFILHPIPKGSFDICRSIFYGAESSGSTWASSNSIFHTGHKS